MFVGFNLKGLDAEILSDYKGSGEVAYNQQKNSVRKELDRFALGDGVLDGSALQHDWFPSVDADVFLSHSHADHKLTMAFAAMLKEEFGLTAFIDSCVWGYANDLLKKIDDKYCKNETGATYNYDKRNYSTSHVHMMLSTALTKMMDKTECLIFINSPYSITTRDVVKEKTNSPWIYSEIATSASLQRRVPERYKVLNKSFNEQGTYEKKSLVIEYDADLSHLTDLSTVENIKWQHHAGLRAKNSPHAALHYLYKEKKALESFHNVFLG